MLFRVWISTPSLKILIWTSNLQRPCFNQFSNGDECGDDVRLRKCDGFFSFVSKDGITENFVDYLCRQYSDWWSRQGSDVEKFYAVKISAKGLGQLWYFLGIEVSQSQCISLSVKKYTFDLLSETGMLGWKPVCTLMQSDIKLAADKDELLDLRNPYRWLVGKLKYLDISYAFCGLVNFLMLHVPVIRMLWFIT